MRALGVDQTRMKADHDLVFAVRRVEADYLRPAVFDDELIVETSLKSISAARIVLQQNVKQADELLFASVVTLVALTSSGRPTRLPADVRQNLS